MAAVSRPHFDSGPKRWNPDDDSIYVLNRGDVAKERARLEYNHHKIWLPLCGGLCPPQILAHLRRLPAPRVAELATGTGIWLRDMAAQLPSTAELRGIDMDTTKFPPASELPKNMSMMQHNALKPFPQEMHGTFDMVHVRLISLGMKKDDWAVVAKHLYALLRPGGYLHWEEVGDSVWRAIPPSKAFDEWMRIGTLWSMKVGRDPLYVTLSNMCPATPEKLWFDVACKHRSRTFDHGVIARTLSICVGCALRSDLTSTLFMTGS
ncbi:N-methyltransferase tcpN [Colletotrichum viniferum]|nr:N-methyltransferase tcpN [Colletotrichum viniferum]